MNITLQNVKPNYMSESEVSGSDIYLNPSLVFEKGNKYLIKADSGRGKSSILNFIFGSNHNYDGTILFDKEKHSFKNRLDKISYVFQDLKLFPELTILENIHLKNKLTNHKSDKEIEELITQVGLIDKKDSILKTLSLGQRQRVALIRALCQPFHFLLLDEPFSHLDDTNIQLLTNIINKELTKQGAGLILTSLGNNYYFQYDKVHLL